MVESTSRQKRKDRITLLAFLVVMGIVLVATTIKGPFTIDEINYAVTAVGLREGRLTVPGTGGLSPSKELFAFDPEPFGRVAARTPVASLAPPLYAPFAVPFLPLGWRGLVLLNTLAFLLTGFLVFVFTKKYSSDRLTPWLALVLVLLGGYGIEYAQGVWPHMLSVLLVTSAVYAAGKVWQGGGPATAIISGLLIGIAAGVREQNIVLAGCLGLTILLYAKRRILASIWYAVGISIPLLAVAMINSARDHLWYPFPKFVAYSNQVKDQIGESTLFGPIRSLWGNFVDYSTHPAITYPFQADMYRQDPATGAFLVLGTVKKAFLQSCPWIGLAFVVLALAWFSGTPRREDARRNLQALSLLVFPLVLIFSIVGAHRSDGLAYNQRYYLEMIPLLAIALALALDGLALATINIVLGVFAGALAFAASLMLPSHALYERALLYAPLVLAAMLIVVWVFRRVDRARLLLPLMVGACLSWALFVHLLDDLPASRLRRTGNAVQLQALEATIPNHSAVFAYRASRDAADALLLTRDVVILDAWADEGADAALLTPELQKQGRRIFVLADFFPRAILNDIVKADSLVEVLKSPISVDEVVKKQNEGNKVH